MNACLENAHMELGDAVPLWDFNIVEAGVIVICNCLFGSKSVVMLLILDRMNAKIKSLSRDSFSYRRSNLIPRTQGVQSKLSVRSSPRSAEALPFGLGEQSSRDAHHELGMYGTPSEYVSLNKSRPFSEPAQAMTHGRSRD